MGRMISLALRSGIPLMEIHRQLRGIASDRAIGLGPNKVLSVPDAIGIVLERWWRDKQGVQQDLLAGQSRGDMPAREQIVSTAPPAPSSVSGSGEQAQWDSGIRNESFIGTCPDCGSSLEFAEGCVKCQVCGFSECG
jgi:ribonucleoside-diphosphate reductase alpha chain